MDLELALWILFFVGGYSVILGYLLKIALSSKEEPGPGRPPG